jgi:tetratricopeptide (TPR) repeat protein
VRAAAGRHALHPVVADYAASLADSSAAAQRLVAYLASLPGRCGDDLTVLGRDESNAFAALHIAERLGQPEDLVRLAHAWFDYFEAGGRLGAARPHLVQAVEAARAAGAPESVGQALEDLARASLMLGEYDQAVQLASEGLGLARRERDANEARAACGFLKVLGLACLSRGEFDTARAFCEQGVAQAEAAGLGVERAALLANLGSILAKQGHVDEATGRARQALTLARALADRRLEGPLLANLGVLVVQRGVPPVKRGRMAGLARQIGLVEAPVEEGLLGRLRNNRTAQHVAFRPWAQAATLRKMADAHSPACGSASWAARR